MKFSKILGIIVRIILTLVLLYLVYNEAGKWTTLCLFLIFINNELVGLAINKFTKILKGLITEL